MEFLLYALFLIVAGVFVFSLARARLSPRPFAGPLLVLALVLFVVCACISYVRLRRIILIMPLADLPDWGVFIQALHEAEMPFYFGLGSFALALLVHLLLYLLSRRHQSPNNALQRTEAGGTSSLHP